MENRNAVTNEDIAQGLIDLRNTLERRLAQKGNHCWMSRHEVLGIITEEYHEVVEEVRKSCQKKELRSRPGDSRPLITNLEHELLDLAVAAIYGYINVKGGHTQW